ncbi:MAG: serine/threonine-protein kinase, partial [Pseudomonadota bacterium]
ALPVALATLLGGFGAMAATFFLAGLVLFALALAAFSSGLALPVAGGLASIILGQAGTFAYRFLIVDKAWRVAEEESADVNLTLGLSFQSQGILDLAFEKFLRVPVDEPMKDILYNLGLDYEKKRKFEKAAAVYEYLAGFDPEFRDCREKIEKLNLFVGVMVKDLRPGAALGLGGRLLIDEKNHPTLGRYEVVKVLGEGAMGVVYLGQDPTIGRTTAIKTIRFGDEYEEDQIERLKIQFLHEAEVAGRLSHPNIVTIYDAGEDHDLWYIAMEYLEGRDLTCFVRKDALLPPRKVLSIVFQVATALDYAHAMGVVHRDVKPANIMLLPNGAAKVTDFGVARAMATSSTKTGVVKGTPFYMSPEQIMGKKVDGRSDIFSLGVVFYQLLTGALPFASDDLAGLIRLITTRNPEPPTKHNPGIPRALVQIIAKAMAKDPEKRYGRAGEMARHAALAARKLDELTAAGKATAREQAPPTGRTRASS